MVRAAPVCLRRIHESILLSMATRSQRALGPTSELDGIENLIRVREDPLAFLRSLAASYGDFVSFRLGRRLVYLLNNEELVRRVFVADWKHFEKPEELKAVNRGSWGDGISTLPNDAWTRRSGLVHKAFRGRRLAPYAREIVECAVAMTDRWRAGDIICLDAEMLSLRARIAARTIYGVDVEHHDDRTEGCPYLPRAEALGTGYITTPRESDGWVASGDNPGRWPEMAEMRRLVRSRCHSQEDGGDVLSALLHGNARREPGLTEEQVVGEAIQLFFGGHHTIPSTLIWLCYVLATSEENRQRLQHEVDTTLEGKRPRLGDLAGMPFGEMLVKETLRFYSPTWLLVRELREDRSVQGHRLERGALVWISPYLLHRDPRYFDAPHRFLPDRFCKGASLEGPRSAFIPFGLGPRSCVGRQLAMMELRLVLAVIAQSRTLEMISDEPVRATASLTIRPANEIHVRVALR